MGLDRTGAVLVSFSPDYDLRQVNGHQKRLKGFFGLFGLGAPTGVADQGV